ncbi:MAG: iron-sulfur cluster assembly accessory protein [Proteobacteria bacterium]|nr:MAG: iron-sulfur cluster assembly accessory protein [Pseudomonadota bacterium]
MTNIGAIDSTLSIGADDLNITDSARAKLGGLIADADDDIKAIRIFVSGGGCSGMNYGMTFADQEFPTDSVIDDGNGFRVVVDPVALGYLQGAEIDFVENGLNASFVFNNGFQAVGGSGACGGCGGGACGA